MKTNLHFLISVIQIILMTIGFNASSQNKALMVAGDENWDESFGASGMNVNVNCFVKKDGILYAGGEFTKAGGNDINRIAQWDGVSWSPIGHGFDQNAVFAVEFFNSALYAGGIFYKSNGQAMKHFAKWNGTEWVQPGSVIDYQVDCLASSGESLYLGGGMIATAGIDLYGIARWDGTQFHAVGGGLWLSDYYTPDVFAIKIVDNDVYVGGKFTRAGTVDAYSIAKWDGLSWSALGGGISGGDGVVTSLAMIGNDLYVAGGFTVAGGVSVNNIARWDGSQWSPLGSGTSGPVSTLAVIGDKLFAGGSFTQAGGLNVNNIAMWDGSQWSSLGSGTNHWVKVLYADGNNLYAGGRFTKAGNKTAKYIARWQTALSVEDHDPDDLQFRAFPNPFSSSTVIRYQLKRSGHVKLCITDITGRELDILTNEVQLPDEHQVTYEASGLPQGIYFVRLCIDNQMVVKNIMKL